MSPGEKRRRQRYRARKAAAHEARMTELRQSGASCGSCKHFERGPPGIKGRVCGLESDWQGYMPTTADQLCTNYATKGSQP